MKPNRIDILDYSRFLAAIIVLLYHYTYNGILNGKLTTVLTSDMIQQVTKYGYLGVDLFFMISGYVIFSSAKGKSSSSFALGRLRRLFPSFWVAVTLTSLVSIYLGTRDFNVTPIQYFANLTMLPRIFGQPFVDGVYWTLQYEIKFYLIIYSLLLFGWGRYLHRFFYIFSLTLLLSHILGWDRITIVNGYFSYFCVGALFYLSRERKAVLNIVGILICYFISVRHAGSVSLDFCGGEKSHCNTLVPQIVITFFYLFFFSLTFKKVLTLKLPFSKWLGGVTYPLYLIHAHIGYMVLNHYANVMTTSIIYFVTITSVLFLSLAIHIVIEIKMSSFWKSFFTKIFSKSLVRLEVLVFNLMLKSKSLISNGFDH